MRRSIIAALVLSLVAATGCSKTGNEDRCREAIRNIFHITGLDKTGSGPDEYAAVRSCRANASDTAIDCMLAAKTADDLAKCDGVDLAKAKAEAEAKKAEAKKAEAKKAEKKDAEGKQGE